MGYGFYSVIDLRENDQRTRIRVTEDIGEWEINKVLENFQEEKDMRTHGNRFVYLESFLVMWGFFSFCLKLVLFD